MSIYVIRHGETASNAARIVQTPDVPLSAQGAAQAERLADRLARANIVAILTSDHVRAEMTAQAIRARTGATLQTEPRLRERNFGDVRGRAYADIGIDILSPDYEPPGGETWAQLYDRVAQVWEVVTAMAQALPGNLAVVTHGLVCHSLATHHLTFPADLVGAPRWANTGVTIVDAEPPWTVRLVNCTAHLEPRKIEADQGAV